MKTKTYFSVLIGYLVFMPYCAAAAGIQANPNAVELSVPAGSSSSAQLAVANPTTDVQLFVVYIDGNQGLITANPSSFTLEAGLRKEVTITAQGSGEQNSILKTHISILSKDLATNEFQANTGVKIPLTIRTTPPVHPAAPAPANWLGIIFSMVAALVLYFAWHTARRSANQPVSS